MSTPEQARAAARSAVLDFSAASGLELTEVGEDRWFTTLAGEHKRTVPVFLDLGERQLAVESFFTRAPDENEGPLFRYLLGRHLRSHVLRFAVADSGDILLIGVLPNAAVTSAEIDVLLGQLLAMADEAFDKALRLGFASYIEREQRWRSQRGVPRNPIT